MSDVVLAAVITGGCTIIAAFIAYRYGKKTGEKNTKKKLLPFSKYQGGYRITHEEVELFFKSRHIVEVRRKSNFVVTSNSLSEIKHSMSWSGQKYKKSVLDDNDIAKGYSIIDDSERQISPFDIIINFPELKKGETGSYTMTTHVEDEQKLMKPCFAHLIKSPSDKLTLKLTVRGNLVESVCWAISAGSFGTNVLCEKQTAPSEVNGDLQVYKIEEKEPELFQYYFIEWKFKK
ncbi:MAG: hypothetical protein FWG83_03540 [Oscillospiraceae bacterium]|nr:hypothetical protein [Oscillospiraceae bacterium]